MGYNMLERIREHEEDVVYNGFDYLFPWRDTKPVTRKDVTADEADRAMSTRKAIYENLVLHVHEEADDNGAWPAQRLAAFRVGCSERQYRKHLGWLVAHGLIFEWRSPRMAASAQTTCYWVVDVVTERRLLDLWRMAAATQQVTLYGVDEAAAVEQMRTLEAAARARFAELHPGHHATDGRILAILEGHKPVVGTTKGEARKGMKAARGAVEASIAARGLSPEDAAALVTSELERRREAGASTSARTLREDLDSGALEHLHPDVADDRFPQVNTDAVPVMPAAVAPAENDEYEPEDDEYALYEPIEAFQEPPVDLAAEPKPEVPAFELLAEDYVAPVAPPAPVSAASTEWSPPEWCTGSTVIVSS